MRLFFVIAFLGIWSQPALGESDTTSTDTLETQWVGVNAVKVGPAFFGSEFKGGVLAYETTTPWPHFTLQVSVKYFAGGTNPDALSTVRVPEHWRLELQGRYYPIKPMQQLFFAPLVNWLSKGGISGGVLMGYQFVFGGRVPLELSAGIQTRNATENYDSPIFLRLGLFTGYIFPKYQ